METTNKTISREVFTSQVMAVIETEEQWDKTMDSLHEFGIDIFEGPVGNAFDKAMHSAIVLLCNDDEELIDTFHWYMYEYYFEKKDKITNTAEDASLASMWDADGAPICYNHQSFIDWLWKNRS